jgi:hypothetical protein
MARRLQGLIPTFFASQFLAQTVAVLDVLPLAAGLTASAAGKAVKGSVQPGTHLAGVIPSAATPTSSLPCPLEAGWEALLTLRLPRVDRSGRPSGGFSAAAYDPNSDTLQLLSDAPNGFVQRWGGLRALVAAAAKGQTGPLPSLQPRDVLPLRSGQARLPKEMDGEGLVPLGADLWVASEGRRNASRPAQLLRFDAATGELRQALEMPAAWQPAPGRGLEENKGPESLALWRRAGKADTLLMASETALLQDPVGQARLLRWELSASGAVAHTLRSLALPGGGLWSLTELLVLPEHRGGGGLLALLRRFEQPGGWGGRLLLYPSPAPTSKAPSLAAKAASRASTPMPPASPAAASTNVGSVNPIGPMPPIQGWDLLARGPGNTGLPADNWEGMSWGPTLADGRASLLLVTDDNFNPFQSNLLAVLAPRRLANCPAKGNRSSRRSAADIL